MNSLISAYRLRKQYNDYVALNDVSFEILEREYVCIIGPSGCGKTTLLRILAGFVQPDAGTVLLGGKSLLEVPASRRPLNMVFQNYALFPHMTVAQNVAFGLAVQKKSVAEQRRTAEEFLEKVDLKGFGDRSISQLSGGQQQRVALARALALHPKVLLLDEPLGALDQKVRRRMQEELKRVQRDIGITFIHVTHDQEEALAMADRIAIMNRGRIEQIGDGRDVYARPKTPFVAEFVGESNRFDARISPAEEHCLLVLPDGDGALHYEGDCPQGEERLVFLRHEDTLVEKVAPTSPGPVDKGQVSEIRFVGDSVKIAVRLPSGRIMASVQRVRDFEFAPLEIGDAVGLRGRPQRAVFFPPGDRA